VNTSLLLAHTARQTTRVGSGWGCVTLAHSNTGLCNGGL